MAAAFTAGTCVRCGYRSPDFVSGRSDQDILLNQLDQWSIRELWTHPALKDGVDIIIEDVLHTFERMPPSWKNHSIIFVLAAFNHRVHLTFALFPAWMGSEPRFPAAEDA
jgi:hypothetical protein